MKDTFTLKIMGRPDEICEQFIRYIAMNIRNYAESDAPYTSDQNDLHFAGVLLEAMLDSPDWHSLKPQL